MTFKSTSDADSEVSESMMPKSDFETSRFKRENQVKHNENDDKSSHQKASNPRNNYSGWLGDFGPKHTRFLTPNEELFEKERTIPDTLHSDYKSKENSSQKKSTSINNVSKLDFDQIMKAAGLDNTSDESDISSMGSFDAINLGFPSPTDSVSDEENTDSINN